ncbi:MAG: ABC-type transport auxiliary lipoprotein family protein [Xanthomonadales bacterium]|nr:ABC-type transport auxiliary lipoprotein family protein [Xanthomonadales bacterium]
MTSLPRSALPVLLALLAGCIRVGLGGGGGEPPAAYHLGAPEPPPGLRPVNWQLVVDRPSAPRSLDGQRIVWIDRDGRVALLPGAQWTDRIPDLVQGALIETLERSAAIAGVDRPTSGLRGDYLLVTEIRAFQLERAADGAFAARVALGLRLLEPARNRIVASRLVEATAPAHGDAPAAAVSAFREAFARVIPEAARWALESGEANRTSVPPPQGR